ncbi:hypothetical protein Oscil6304_2216 [Oscillatoria acuminata PCC 6304]|uniref:Uncharacterized protein n=1 Tax=Oscillatoria acuminata PCC 6304 TaxID=56110 RepID=K9TH45_9CYAN|nr:hypothetical protein Oscil6304_2216 [Oscillatoria acuminata PCC 6304]
MNAHIFESHSVLCPVCNRSGHRNPGEILGGLYTCPHCQARLVISWSGHYVRDPFTFKQLSMSRLLRRQSSPVARILRDVGIKKRPSFWAVLAGLVVAGLTFATLENWNGEFQLPGQFTEESGEVRESWPESGE